MEATLIKYTPDELLELLLWAGDITVDQFTDRVGRSTHEDVAAIVRRNKERGMPVRTSDGASLVIEIPELAPSLNRDNGLMRMHWAVYAKLKEKWTYMIRAAAGTQRWDGPCYMVVHRYYAGRPLDFDNLYAAVKVPGDALRAAKVIDDDNPEVVTGLTCYQFKVATKNEQKTVIYLSPPR